MAIGLSRVLHALRRSLWGKSARPRGATSQFDDSVIVLNDMTGGLGDGTSAAVSIRRRAALECDAYRRFIACAPLAHSGLIQPLLCTVMLSAAMSHSWETAMMRMRKRGFTACATIAALVTTGLWAMTSTPAAAGGVSLSIRTPGLAIHAGPPGVAISVGQPGFYGEIGIGDLPAPPPVIYASPVIIAGRAVGPPMYVHVPPGYERHWAEHCALYRACARPVYFVRDNWYQHDYVPRYRRLEEARRVRDARLHERELAREHARFHEERIDHDRRVYRDDHAHGFDHHGDDHDHRFDHHDDAHADHGHEDHGHGH